MRNAGSGVRKYQKQKIGSLFIRRERARLDKEIFLGQIVCEMS